ncbi:glycoside hydrolase family 27 protein [Proteiniphilum sp. UBA5384]|uniref:glycoside hydrolase family 27 protein n=1 Tax=Proteiniphilum sp. UBA5384 TaxID=1947279 RepID=UPI0025DD87A8|nr:glycoside hydrolase family 27 protein [Proteiniphilum sp. UBA5384]
MNKRIIKVIALLLVLQSIIVGNSFSQNQRFKNLATTPPMGWNSWNWFGKHDINEQLVREVIDAMVSTGLRDAGYRYMVIDGGWRDTKLGPNGELLCHPVKFPNGIKPLADYAHERGLKIGLHTVPGTHDCAGDPVGGYGYEEVHIAQFVDWGIDFIKLDRCQYNNEEGWTEELIHDLYTKWSELIQETGRDIIFNISAYEFREWNPEISHMSRTTYDISAKVTGGANFIDETPVDNFLSVMTIAEQNNEVAEYARTGYWNDPDMMVTGEQGLTLEEQKAHFALWCIMSSPLFLGNDPRNMTSEERGIILNETAIAINQAPGGQGTRIQQKGDTEIWAKRMCDGKTAVLLLNRKPDAKVSISFDLKDIGVSGKARIHDIYAEKELGIFYGKFSGQVSPRSGLFILVE